MPEVRLNNNKSSSVVHEDPWESLRRVTDARIALGRAGSSLPLQASLSFKLDHARARDAVHMTLQHEQVAEILRNKGLQCLELESEIKNRSEYLTRPDKGRCLSRRSKGLVAKAEKSHDVCLVLTDGLSARAVHEQGAPFILGAEKILHKAGYTIGPVCVVQNGRVAVGDVIGQLLNARLVAVLIGERPGLSSPNSMGLYLTLNPVPGTTDERRNCVSNIREGGLNCVEALRKFAYLVEEALRLGSTGVSLKDRMSSDYLPFGLPITHELR